MFADVSTDSYWYPLIKRFYDMGVANGYPDGTFKPDKTISRVECLAFLEKYRVHAAEMLKALAFSVLTIKGHRANGTTSLGSGVVLDSNGYIATNAHVAMDGLDPWDELMVYFDNIPTGYKPQVVLGDFAQDIAILKIEAPQQLLQPVKVASSVELLDEVYCIGNPLGYSDTASKGVVSCAKRVVGATEWIQTDASINPGNSGGGAFNFLGELVGLPTWIVVWADEAKTIPINNIGFITPYYKVQELYQKARGGKVGFAGEPVSFIIE